MIDVKYLKYSIANDINNFINIWNGNIEDCSYRTGISKATIYEILKSNKTTGTVYEKFYSSIYRAGYRLNSVKEDFLKETTKNKILFHGAKEQIFEITHNGSRKNCDFGKGFYLGETYDQALSFVNENRNSSVYSFELLPNSLKIVEFSCDLEWMLAICYFRGNLKEYKNSPLIKKIINKVKKADIIIAPIADNNMFYIMSSFVKGEINCDVAIHSLSTSKLGKQYVFKTEKSLEFLKPIEKYYLCQREKEDCGNRLKQRGLEIETKLKLAKREYRNGLFIEEILNEKI